ncbi:hypothetical protein GCM10008933_21660 [Paenibacillus motobuensis]|uniref:DUF2188 domain-containing protein n=1 Tax=Paenibacillus motobuensis TaxID=295324 RepID=A0ABN0YDR8_9BACL
MDFNIYVEQISPGDWRVCQSPTLYPPSGKISKTSYPTQEAALEAKKAGKLD